MLSIRFKQRETYLEDPNFERLSDVLKTKAECYNDRDNYIFIALLNGYDERIIYQRTNPNSYKEIEDLFLESYDRKGINWHGIYQYYQARKKSVQRGEYIDGCEPDVDSDIGKILKILEKHKTKILQMYHTF